MTGASSPANDTGLAGEGNEIMNSKRLGAIEAVLRSAGGGGLHVIMTDCHFYANDPARPVPFTTPWGGRCWPQSKAPAPQPGETWVDWDDSFDSLAGL